MTLGPRTQISPVWSGPRIVAGVVLGGDFHAGNGQSDGTGFPRAANGIERNHGAGFAQAVAFEERKREAGGEFPQNLRRQRRGAADANAQGQIGGQRGAGQGAEELRDGRQKGGAMADDFLQNVLGRVERFDQDNGAADAERQQNPHREHEAVEHGQENDEAVFPDGFERHAAAFQVGQQIGVGQHRALGMAGGAGGVNDDGKSRLRDCGLRIARLPASDLRPPALIFCFRQRGAAAICLASKVFSRGRAA